MKFTLAASALALVSSVSAAVSNVNVSAAVSNGSAAVSADLKLTPNCIEVYVGKK